MSTSILSIKDKLVKSTRHQRTPATYDDDDYIDFCVDGCQRFYIDTGIEASWDSEYTDCATPILSRDLDLIEKEYCLVCAEIQFFENVRNHWNTLVSYTTNALKIANANKPFEFIDETIRKKENRLIELFHKMTDVSNMTQISEIDASTLDVDY